MKKKRTRFAMTKEKISKIKELLNQAEDLYNKVPVEIQEAMLDYHNQDYTLGHCLRWGLQAAEDIVDDWDEVVLGVDEMISETPETLYKGKERFINAGGNNLGAW